MANKIVESIKAWALANYGRSYGASCLVECFTDDELQKKFTSLAAAKRWAKLRNEAQSNCY